MYFVDDVNLVTGSRGCVKRILEQFPHLFHLRIGSRIHLKQINEAPRINFSAGRTYPQGDEVMPVRQLRALARMRAIVVLPIPRYR